MRSFSSQKKVVKPLTIKKEPSTNNIQINRENVNINIKPSIKMNPKDDFKISARNKISSTGMKIINSNTTMKLPDKIPTKTTTVKNPFAEMPSTKYTKIKSSDPFALGKKHKTNFGYVYSVAGIPCRIEHGAIKLKLKWDVDISSLIY